MKIEPTHFRVIQGLIIVLVTSIGWAGESGRRTLDLNGRWEIADSMSADSIPTAFNHHVIVPGLVNQARPAFPDVDSFDSQELIANRIRKQQLPESARVHTPGISRQERNYFWYRTHFSASKFRANATLRINKAQFGTAVWLNGKPVGEHAGCFTAGIFDLSAAIRWNAKNELLIRIGAHPGVLPASFPAGTDFEKLKWTPGIYDRVSVWFCDDPAIISVQVAPRVGTGEVLVQTRLKNYGIAPRATALRQEVRTWKSGKVVARSPEQQVKLLAGEEKTVEQLIPVPDAHLWSPDDPFLYVVETRTRGDSLETRFGMREFRADAKTGRFYLNGKACYLRGSNITLHRFFEDPSCGDLPWNEKWLRQLLSEIPRSMHWNSFRFCIGPVPEQWLEIADETGLLVQNEFFIWTGAPNWDRNYARHWDVPEMTRQYSEWLRDNWNHPSVAIWDANNETLDPVFGTQIIPAVRSLDLSARPWENSYNAPAEPNDPIEYHPYLYQGSASGNELKFRLSDLEQRSGKAEAWYVPAEPHPILINEYGWVWLNRDGSPTLLTEKLYPLVLGPDSTPDMRFAWNAYVLAAKTEFWRAHRQMAGVLHFVYLTCSYPGVYTSDHFIDVTRLKLDPHFADYLGEAFKPLGVCVNFFQTTITPTADKEFEVLLVNDQDQPTRGDLVLSLENESRRIFSTVSRPFEMGALGETAVAVRLPIPAMAQGKCILKCRAVPAGPRRTEATLCRRWILVK